MAFSELQVDSIDCQFLEYRKSYFLKIRQTPPLPFPSLDDEVLKLHTIDML